MWTFFFASVAFSGTPSSFLSWPLFSLIGKFASSRVLGPHTWSALDSNGVISAPRPAIFLNVTPFTFRANFTSTSLFVSLLHSYLCRLISCFDRSLLWNGTISREDKEATRPHASLFACGPDMDVQRPVPDRLRKGRGGSRPRGDSDIVIGGRKS